MVPIYFVWENTNRHWFCTKNPPLNYGGGGKISKPKNPKHGLCLETKNETGQNSTGLWKTFFWSFWMKLIPEYL